MRKRVKGLCPLALKIIADFPKTNLTLLLQMPVSFDDRLQMSAIIIFYGQKTPCHTAAPFAHDPSGTPRPCLRPVLYRL